MIHKPVMPKEIMEVLDPKRGEFFIDGTLGGGGHARLIIEAVGESGMLLAIDRDPLAVAEFKSFISDSKPKVIVVNDNFAHLPTILAGERLPRADGLLLDLGISSDQLERTGRGFSFQKNEPLLMTFSDNQKPARELLLELSENDLAEIISELSDERYAKAIAREIKETLRRNAIATTFDLRDAILRAVPASYKHGRIDPSTRTFMALRIYANQEFENLRIILNRLDNILKPGGRVAILTFHSNEDRIVKNVLRDASKAGVLTLINKKVITASREEIRQNPRARSAKLRAAIIAGSVGADVVPEIALAKSSRFTSSLTPRT